MKTFVFHINTFVTLKNNSIIISKDHLKTMYQFYIELKKLQHGIHCNNHIQ